jgi:hypothetical protein
MGGDLRPGTAATLPDGTTLEVFLDEPGHVRMANPDEELIALPAASARHRPPPDRPGRKVGHRNSGVPPRG